MDGEARDARAQGEAPTSNPRTAGSTRARGSTPRSARQETKQDSDEPKGATKGKQHGTTGGAGIKSPSSGVGALLEKEPKVANTATNRA